MAATTSGRRDPDDYATSWLDTGNRNGQEDLKKGLVQPTFYSDAGSVPVYESPGMKNKSEVIISE